MYPTSSFDIGANGLMTADGTSFIVVSIGVVIIMLWAGWVLIKIYRDWTKEQIKGKEVIGLVIRTILQLSFLSFLIAVF